MKWFLFQVAAWAGSIVATWYGWDPAAVFSATSAIMAAALDPYRKVQWWPGRARALLCLAAMGSMYLAAAQHRPLEMTVMGVILVLAV